MNTSRNTMWYTVSKIQGKFLLCVRGSGDSNHSELFPVPTIFIYHYTHQYIILMSKECSSVNRAASTIAGIYAMHQSGLLSWNCYVGRWWDCRWSSITFFLYIILNFKLSLLPLICLLAWLRFNTLIRDKCRLYSSIELLVNTSLLYFFYNTELQ
jgi:hypothetical protein